MSDRETPYSAGERFKPTRWTMVLRAQAGSTEALEELGRAYWPAIFAFLRGRGFSPQDAEDLTQETLGRLLEGSRLEGVNPNKGRFRSFLCACAAHEASHFRQRQGAQKRDGQRTLAIEELRGELEFQPVHLAGDSLEWAFDRAWSQILVQRALDHLRAEYERLGRRALLEQLLPLLNERAPGKDFRRVADALGIREGNARVAWVRFKTLFLKHVRQEVADTVSDPAEVESELRHLLRAWLSEGTRSSLSV